LFFALHAVVGPIEVRSSLYGGGTMRPRRLRLRGFCENIAMAKAKTLYVCGECGASQPKWSGQCPDCGAWNSLEESAAANAGGPRQRSRSWTGEASAEVVQLGSVHAEDTPRFSSGLSELDRVLGGGLVPGSVILIGGDPGIGKSTLLLQAQAAIAGD
jgi:DNA repair protein RadA/Sms